MQCTSFGLQSLYNPYFPIQSLWLFLHRRSGVLEGERKWTVEMYGSGDVGLISKVVPYKKVAPTGQPTPATANGNYAFHACYGFLKSTIPSRFREIGSLAGFLLAADFSYAGMVQPPTATEVGEIIRCINKGGVRGLELLGLVCERPHGNGRVFKMRNADKIKAAFCRLHGFLDNKLSAAQKAHIVFDAIMTAFYILAGGKNRRGGGFPAWPYEELSRE
ncbi:hypothetical protein C8R47DRAFT_1072198 [Mycena vitilis]|nr:hypothetical protein C8R47DRAFT_1072198 [Mycena vitilis]